MLKKTPLRFSSALVVANNNGEAAMDRSALRQLGIRNVRMTSSGITAAKLLATQADSLFPASQDVPPFDIVLCDERLSDMNGNTFTALLRKHPRLKSFPIVTMSHKATKEAVLDAIKAGCSGYIVRPYTTENVFQQLSRVYASTTATAALNLEEEQDGITGANFEEALAKLINLPANNELEADHWFTKGVVHMGLQNWNAAIAAFNKAISINELHAESYLEMAKAWRHKGSEDNYQKYLKLAAETYVRLEEYQTARIAFAELLSEFPDQPNPMLNIAGQLVRQNRISAAACTFIEGHKLTPHELLHQHVARACMFTARPEQVALSLCRAIARMGEKDAAVQLYRRIVALPRREQMPEQKIEKTKWYDKFPALQEMVAVASYTLRSFKELEATE